MAQLFVTIASEEIPARMQQAAGRNLQDLMMKALDEAGLAPSGPQAFWGPRHIALSLSSVLDKQPDRQIERRGPRSDAPDKAIDGFCQSVGMTRDELVIEQTDKGAFLFARKLEDGQATAALLPEIITNILSNFPWPKSQRWGTSRKSWVRPMHHISVLLDGKVVEGRFDLGGDMHIAFGNQATGHPFHNNELFAFESATHWQETMRAHHVIVDAAEKQAMIQSQIAEKCADLDIELIPDDGLMNEVTGLVEWPNAIIGKIGDDFMSLPEEVLITSMRVHQKYFATRALSGPHKGQIAPYFVTIANRLPTPDTDKLIAQGNERVLRARLADAAFFYEQDKAKPLADYVPALSAITFYDGLGSVGDKAERITKLAGLIASHITGADAEVACQAAHLAKADLVTDMVGEFPELQGLMGGYYAAHHGASEALITAIADHYKPAGPSDRLPATPTALAVSLADKIDTLVGFFGIGAKPTGSKDPFALRRAALSVLRIIDECDVPLPLAEICDAAAQAYGFAAADDELASFIRDRMIVMLRESGIAHDVVASAVAGAGMAYPHLMMMKARYLAQALSGQEGAHLIAGFKRANNILAAEQKKAKEAFSSDVDEALFVADEEHALYQAVQAIPDGQIDTNEALEALIGSLGALSFPINAFFEAIIVNDDDEAIRANRLALLSQIISQMGKVADFAMIEG